MPSAAGSGFGRTTENNRGGFLGGTRYMLEKVGAGFLSSVEGLVDFAAGGVAKLLGDAFDNEDMVKWSESLIENDWEDYSAPEKRYNPSKGWQIAGDVASGLGTSASVLLGGIGAGGIAAKLGATAATTAAVGTGAGALTAGLGAAGRGVNEAYQESGQLTGKEWGYGALTGATEASTEALTSLLTLGTGKIIKSVAGSMGRSVGKTVAKEAAEAGLKTTLKSLGGSALGEGFEEAVSTVLSPYWKRMTYDPSAENATAEEIGYSAFVGALSGLVMDGGRIAAGSTASYLAGNALARDGKADGVLSLSDQLSSFYEKNQSDNEVFRAVSQTYRKLSESLASTRGRVETVGQKKMLGDLQKLNVSAAFTPFVTKSAVNIVANADTVAEKLTAYGMKDASGKLLTFTADQIRAGIDTTNQKTLSKSLTAALESNNVLRTLAVADATGHLMMDTAKFEQATLMGRQLASQVDINRFYETATPAEINAVSDALGIDNWATLTPAVMGQKITDYISRGGVQAYADTKRAKAAFEAIPVESAQKMPSKLNLTSDGAVRYAEGALSVAIEKKGDSYRIYDYGTGNLTKFVPADTVNGLLASYRSQVDSVLAQEETRQREEAEVESFARENVSEYKNLGDANQSMIRRLIRNGRAVGISDTDLATYASVSARSGLDIVFDKQSTRRGTDANGAAQYADGYYSATENRIVVNPEGTRSAERLLIHELDHAIRQSHGVTAYRQALEGVSDEVRQNIVQNYASVAADGSRTELVMDETNARYAEDVLSNKHTLERLVAAEPTLKERILSFFKGASTDYADTPKLSHAAKKYYSTYKKLFNSFAEGNYQGNAYGGDTNKNAVTSMNTGNMQVTESERKYSISEKNKIHADNFQKRIDAWDKKTEGFAFVIGETPSYLSELDVSGKKIGKKQVRVDATKVKKIMQDHSEMTTEVIKNLPYLLNDPILVLDSKTVKGRLVLLGEVYANNKPVMMALEINPTTRSGNSTYVDVIKVTSAYTRSNTQNLINSSNIRFVNENKSRVNDWLKVNRLQLPLPNSQSNSATNSIPQNSEKVNRNSEKTDKKVALPDNEVTRAIREDEKKRNLNYSDPLDMIDSVAKKKKLYDPNLKDKLFTNHASLRIDTVDELYGIEYYLRNRDF